MQIKITDFNQAINKDSIVEVTIDGSKYQVDYISYSFQESEHPTLNQFTKEIDSRYSSTTELKLNATVITQESK